MRPGFHGMSPGTEGWVLGAVGNAAGDGLVAERDAGGMVRGEAAIDRPVACVVRQPPVEHSETLA